MVQEPSNGKESDDSPKSLDTDPILDKFVDLANSRRSIRSFLDEPVPDDVLKGIIDYKKTVDPTFAAGGNGKDIREAPVTVVTAGDTRFDRWWPQILDGSREKLFHHSLAACIQNLYLAAAAAGLGTTWITVRPPTEHRLRELLDLPAWYRTRSVAPLGYPDPDRNPEIRPRMPVSNKVHENTFDSDQGPTTEEIMENDTEWFSQAYQAEDEDDWIL